MTNKLRATAASLVLLLIALSSIAWLVIGAAHQRGLVPEVSEFIDAAQRTWQTGSLPRSAFYPPGVTLIVLGVRALGITSIDPFVFNFCLLALGVTIFHLLARRLLRNDWLASLAGILALLNPYFVWTAMLSKDTSAEFCSLAGFLWLMTAALDANASEAQHAGRSIGILLFAVLMSLVRVTNVFVALATFALVFVWPGQARRRKWIAKLSVAFTAFVLAFCGYNYYRVGAFNLATNGGYNLYLGNHPAYLHGHPHYDIDVFLRSIDRHEELAPLDESTKNREYTRRAVKMIKADPSAFLYRLIVKSEWHWFNLEKIPNYTSATQVLSDQGTSGCSAELAPIRAAPNLAYVLYKIFYLPVFIFGLILFLRRRIPVEQAVLFAPMFGLWPVVALTFPDTRFKICAEVIATPALLTMLVASVRERQMKWDSPSKSVR